MVSVPVEFTVVSDFFLTPTAQLADLVLPAATWLEQEDIVSLHKIWCVLSRTKVAQIGETRDDREVMIQILTNLIENSVKFGKAAPRREITLRVRPKGSWMNISVSDTGPGIPRYALKKVFDDFYRVESDLTRTTSGTGIGLALVKRFVTAMGGSIEAKNNEEPGCTITISVPV